jgi:peptidyl-prolyl cis-trans isomerase SurA
MMKTIKFLLFLALSSPTLHVHAQLSDKVIAVVDGDVILQSEFNERLLNINDNQLNQTLTAIAEQNNMTFEQFRNVLNNEGGYLNFREQIRRDMMINNLQSNAVNGRISITRQEVENYLRSEAAQIDIAPEYRINHILISFDSLGRNQRAEELAELLYQRIQDGEDILQLASSGQILGMSVSGGDLTGWRKPENLPTMFRPVVPDLTVGEVSEPFRSDSGFHIVKVVDKRGGSDLQVNQTHLRHIQIRPNEIRTPQQAESLINDLNERIGNGEDFGDLARVYTDDPGTMVSGGDLDWMTEGQLPPAYQQIINSLEIDEISAPFQVEGIWHIAQVLDRRVEDVTDENRRFQAEQIIRERKYETELENWLSEIRDTAYVDIKLGDGD